MNDAICLEPAPARANRVRVMPRRRFWSLDDRGVRVWVVAESARRMFELIADLDVMDDGGPVTIREHTEEEARAIKIRPDDSTPAEVLADAPLGSAYSTEV